MDLERSPLIRPGELPEICPRPAHWTEIPKNAGLMRDLAEDHGWATELVYARGQGTGPRVVDLIVLRLQRDDTWIAATYHDGRFHSAIRHTPLARVNSRELKALVEAPRGQATEPWPPEVAAEPRQELREEYEVLGYYLSSHPLEWVNRGRYSSVVDAAEVADEHGIPAGEKVELLGVVEEPQIKTTRRTQTLMGLWSLSDLSGAVPCFTFGEDNCAHLTAGALVHVVGEITDRDETKQVKVSKIKEIDW